MTVRTRLLAAVFLLLIPPVSRVAAQDSLPRLSEGLWEAKRRFGPDVRGTLTIVQGDGEWRAEIAGVQTTFRPRGDTVAFDLPNGGGALIGYLSRDRTTIAGHWIQPRNVANGNEFASPVRLTRSATGGWTGTVSPLDDTMTMYLLLRRRADGSFGGFLRNTERNLGRQLRLDHLESVGSEVRYIGKFNGNGAARVLGSGVFNADGFSLFIPGRGGTFDFTRVADSAYSDFYPRGRPTGSYSYSRPPSLGDGWNTGTPHEVGLSEDSLSAFIRAMINLPMDSLSSLQIHAVLIARHGKLILEEYFHGENRDHPHESRSAAKSITATLIGAAIHAKRGISLASTPYSVMSGGTFPDTIEPRKRRVTVENLLSMSSGIDCDDANSDSPGNESAMIDQTDEPDYYRFILRLKTIREPGEKAVYCSVQPHLAGGVLKNATRTSLPDLFASLVAAPLGIDRYYLPLTPTRDMYGGGGVRLTARSFSKIAQMYLDSGVWKGKRVLDADFVRKAGAPRYSMSGIRYGLAWWVIDYPFRGETVEGYFASGNGGQLVMAIPKLDMVVTIFAANYQDSAGLIPQQQLIPKYVLPALEAR
ncbi:MAG TPA: serine hydrolase [Gemmatimonadaceae bacterium]|nr:serine hydrolase [Gemmatimonadaceae bacterium]